MLCTSVTCTFFAVCGGTMKGRIKRNVALWLGWSISFTRVGARWAYILLQAQRQNVEIDPVVLVFGIVATAIITLTVGPLFRQDLGECWGCQTGVSHGATPLSGACNTVRDTLLLAMTLTYT